MQRNMPLAAVMLIVSLASAASTLATENKITPTLDSVDVIHNGATVTIKRGHDRNATLPEIFQKTDRGCPPFCVEPMVAAPGIETIGELEVLDYLHRIAQGASDILIVDSRTPDWVMRGTIPGSINIPWNKINRDKAGTFETPAQADNFHHVMEDQFGVSRNAATGVLNFSDAKTLVLFCNGIWCPQSTANIKTLVGIGYPLDRLKWYRGGMQDWVSVGLTIVTP